MARKKRKKVKLTQKQKARMKRAEKAAIKRIAIEEGITQKEARRLHKRAVLEVVFDRPARYVQRKFIEISPGKFREIPEGKPVREVNAVGPIRNIGYVEKIQNMKQYWELINIISEERGISIPEARAAYTEERKQQKSRSQIIFEITGESP